MARADSTQAVGTFALDNHDAAAAGPTGPWSLQDLTALALLQMSDEGFDYAAAEQPALTDSQISAAAMASLPPRLRVRLAVVNRSAQRQLIAWPPQPSPPPPAAAIQEAVALAPLRRAQQGALAQAAAVEASWQHGRGRADRTIDRLTALGRTAVLAAAAWGDCERLRHLPPSWLALLLGQGAGARQACQRDAARAASACHPSPVVTVARLSRAATEAATLVRRLAGAVDGGQAAAAAAFLAAWMGELLGEIAARLAGLAYRCPMAPRLPETAATLLASLALPAPLERPRWQLLAALVPAGDGAPVAASAVAAALGIVAGRGLAAQAAHQAFCALRAPLKAAREQASAAYAEARAASEAASQVLEALCGPGAHLAVTPLGSVPPWWQALTVAMAQVGTESMRAHDAWGVARRGYGGVSSHYHGAKRRWSRGMHAQRYFASRRRASGPP